MIPLEQMTDEQFERTLWTFSIANWACTVLRAFCASTERARATTRATAISGSRGLRLRNWLGNSKAARSSSVHEQSSNHVVEDVYVFRNASRPVFLRWDPHNRSRLETPLSLGQERPPIPATLH
jgi:hypothetical protein